MKITRKLTTTTAAFITALAFASVHAQNLPNVPADTSVAVATGPQADYGVLAGRWVRPDGGYVISIKSVDVGGKLDASYANPHSLPFSRAEATRDGIEIRLFFELRSGGYNGSTYTLIYDATSDQLKGVYYQAVARQKFEVVFDRK